MPKKKFSKNAVAVALLAFVLILAVAPTVSRGFGTFISSGAAVPPAQTAPGSTGSGDSCGIVFGTISGCIYLVVDFVNAIMHFLVGLGAAVVTYILAVSKGLVNLAAVQTGFSVSLSVANLGFVFGIIVIALATILRSQTYGIKQVLWKLVVAAILVNFGLIIAGVVVNFADQFTNYFTTAATNGTGDLSSALANAFGTSKTEIPQQSSEELAPSTITGLSCQDGCWSEAGVQASCVAKCQADAARAAASNNAANSVTHGIDAAFKALLALVFVIIFTFIVAFTLFALAILLIIRFIYVAILLIILPLAWLMWVFPKFSHLFSKWWAAFLRWAFFPAIATFFLYLAVATATNLPTASGINGATATVAIDTNMPALISAFFNLLIIAGLSLGGLFAANSLGIAGASVAMGTMKSVGTAAQGYVGKQTAKGGRFVWQKAGGEKVKTSLQEGRIGAAIKKRIPYVGGVAGGIVQRGESLAGRAAAKLSTNEKMVAEAKKNVPKDWEESKKNLKGNMNHQENFAAIASGVEQKKIKKTDMVGNMTVAEYLDQKDLVKRYGQGKLKEDASELFMEDSNYRSGQKALAANPEEAKRIAEEEAKVRDAAYKTNYSSALSQGMTGEEAKRAAEAGAAAEAERFAEKNRIKAEVADDIKDENGNVIYEAGQMVDAVKLMNVSLENMLKKFSGSDFSNVDANSLFGTAATATPEKLKEVELRLKNIALYAPQGVNNLLRNMNAPTLFNFQKHYISQLEGLIAEHTKQLEALKKDTSKEGLEKAQIADQTLKLLKANRDKFDNLFANVAFGGWGKRKGEGKKEETEEEEAEEGKT